MKIFLGKSNIFDFARQKIIQIFILYIFCTKGIVDKENRSASIWSNIRDYMMNDISEERPVKGWRGIEQNPGPVERTSDGIFSWPTSHWILVLNRFEERSQRLSTFLSMAADSDGPLVRSQRLLNSATACSHVLISGSGPICHDVMSAANLA